MGSTIFNKLKKHWVPYKMEHREYIMFVITKLVFWRGKQQAQCFVQKKFRIKESTSIDEVSNRCAKNLSREDTPEWENIY